MDVDDTLVLILERIASPVTLIRAASTCRRWRRLIADAGFLRRYRSLHGRAVAGDYYNHFPVHNVITLFVPSSSSIVDARRFSLDFLAYASILRSPPQVWYYQSPWYYTAPAWQVRESRGSLLLMEYTQAHKTLTLFPDLVVCEPLTRRYKIIPPPPDLALDNNDSCVFWGPYLVDGDEDEAGGRIGVSNFRVQCVLFSHGVAHTTVFTAADGWSDKAIDHIASRLDQSVNDCLGHAGSTYYYVIPDGTLVTHDHSTGKFSSSVLSHAARNCWDRHLRGWEIGNFFVIDGGDGEPRIVSVKDNIMEVFARLDGEWALVKKVLLSTVISGLHGYQPSFTNQPLTIVKRGVGFIVMSPREIRHQWYFSIDLKTMEVAPAPEPSVEKMTFQCEFPWPPVLQACLDR